MNEGNATIEWGEERLLLMRQRAVWWERGETLLIADPHFGKAATFRFAGIPVPENPHDEDLVRLSEILMQTKARRLVILGDFFHAKSGRSEATMSALSDWRKRHRNLEVVLVLGNHDRHAGLPPVEWAFECSDKPWQMRPFVCRHEPVLDRDRFVFAGHLHPGFHFV